MVGRKNNKNEYMFLYKVMYFIGLPQLTLEDK